MHKIIFLILAVASIHSLALAHQRHPNGGGSVAKGSLDHHSAFEQMNRWNHYLQDRNRLIEENRLVITPQRGNNILYNFPLRTTQSYPDYYAVTNFVDMEAGFPNILGDYNCGSRTYDTASGYNHAGVDYLLWPYPWSKQDNNEVEVIAAAAGTITTKLDGNYDRVCEFSSPLNTGWNAVYITHADGSSAWYGHLKNGSLTSKPVGSTVQAGEYLGVVGSSGNSTDPHLHFETHDVDGFVIEPHSGACNTLNAESWWHNQKPYYDSKLNQVATHAAAPVIASCPTTTDDPAIKTVFRGGETIVFAAYYRDQLSAQISDYQVLRPDGSVFASWQHSSPHAHLGFSFWYWNFILPAAPQNGRWTYRVSYESQIVEHYFYLGDALFSNGFE